MTFLPLTRRPGGVQAFKQIFPPDPPPGSRTQQTHEGYEWLYVLSGRLRLLLGEHDLIADRRARWPSSTPASRTSSSTPAPAGRGPQPLRAAGGAAARARPTRRGLRS